MRMEPLIANGSAAAPLIADAPCPFYHPETGSCRAASSGLRIEWRRRRNHCTTEDHDECTLFLGKLLRCSLPKARFEWPIGQK